MTLLDAILDKDDVEDNISVDYIGYYFGYYLKEIFT